MDINKTSPDVVHTDNDLELLLKEVTKMIQEIETMLANVDGEEE